MKPIKKIVDGNKGLTAFLLVMIFLNISFARSMAYGFAPSVKLEFSKLKSDTKQDLTYKAQETSGVNAWDQFKKDTDSDDFDFVLFANTSSKLLIPHFAKQEIAEFNLYRNTYTVSLYDLYCNWKFHLI